MTLRERIEAEAKKQGLNSNEVSVVVANLMRVLNDKAEDKEIVKSVEMAMNIYSLGETKGKITASYQKPEEEKDEDEEDEDDEIEIDKNSPYAKKLAREAKKRKELEARLDKITKELSDKTQKDGKNTRYNQLLALIEDAPKDIQELKKSDFKLLSKLDMSESEFEILIQEQKNGVETLISSISKTKLGNNIPPVSSFGLDDSEAKNEFAKKVVAGL